MLSLMKKREVTALSEHNLICVRCKVERSKADEQHRTFQTLDSRKAADMTQALLHPLIERGEVSYEAFKDRVVRAINRSRRRLQITKRFMVHSKEIKQKFVSGDKQIKTGVVLGSLESGKQQHKRRTERPNSR